MKKDIEWLKKEIATEMIELEPNRKERWSDVKYQTLRDVAQKIYQLDEPEALSQKWIDEHATAVTYDEILDQTEIVYVDDLENLIIPKEESEVTLNRAFDKVSETYPMTKEEVYRHLEKFVAHGGRVTYGEPEVLSQEWIDENKEARINNLRKRTTDDVVPVGKLENLLVPKQEELESKIKVLIEAYKQEDGAYSNPENGWISGFVEDLENLVEEEPKYYVSSRESVGFWFLSKNNDNEVVIGTNKDYYDRKWESLKLTEEEIKDYDSRYWAFAVKVEELGE